MSRFILIQFCVFISAELFAQGNHIDTVRGDAPELARFGGYDIGVRALQLLDPGRVDVVNTPRGEDNAAPP